MLVASGAFGASAFLEASADKSSAQLNEDVAFTVVNGKDRKPVESSTMVAGGDGPKATTNAEGVATIKFSKAGVYKYKATKGGTIRSNEVTVTAEGGNWLLTQTGCRHNPGCCD